MSDDRARDRVKAAARAMFAKVADINDSETTWEDLAESSQAEWCTVAQAALEAAAGMLAEPAEIARLRAIIADAGLETYTPDGSERVAAHLTEQQRTITRLRAQVQAVRELADRLIRKPGSAGQVSAGVAIRAALDGVSDGGE